jgi:transposase
MTDTDVESLPDDAAQLKSMMKRLIREHQLDKEQLEHRLAMLLRSKYGPRSEKLDPDQLDLFDLGREDVQDACDEPADDEGKLPPKRLGHGRRRLPADLPRTRVEHELPEGDRLCPCCGKTRKRIGWETSEQVEYEPAKLYVIEHARAKYACDACEENVVTSPKPAQPIDKGLAAPGLLAAIAVGKYGDHLPLYRMEEILSRSGLSVSRSTQCDWMRRIAELVEPVVSQMKSEILASRVIWTDDTTVPVLDPTQSKTKTGRMWVYIGDLRHRYAVFDYTPDRKGARPREFLGEYAGYLQADAYSGYDQLCDHGNVTEVACWAHARRKFHEAKDSARVGAAHALNVIGQLYGLERKASKLDAAARRELRQKHAVGKLETFASWLDQQSVEILPKSPLGKAITYARNQWAALCRYTENGELSIDNNLSERTLRCVAIGRKNWMFAGSDRGGQTAATLMSLIATCKLLGVDPYRYLRDLLTELPSHQTDHLEEFLPDHWLPSHPEAKLTDHGKQK